MSRRARKIRRRDLPPSHDPKALPAVRDMLSMRPLLATLDTHEVAILLVTLGYLPCPPSEAQVAAALEALDIETGAA